MAQCYFLNILHSYSPMLYILNCPDVRTALFRAFFNQISHYIVDFL